MSARLKEAYDAFVVEVTESEGVWTAECDPLGLVTEADSYEALTERAWAIAPELAELNGFDVDPESLRLRFQHIESGAHRSIAH